MKATLKSLNNNFTYQGNGNIAVDTTSTEELENTYTVEFSGLTSNACTLKARSITLYVYTNVGGVVTANTQTAETIYNAELIGDKYRAEFKFKEGEFVEITTPCLEDETPRQTSHLEARLNGTTWIEDGSTVSFGCSAITEDDQQYIQLRAYYDYDAYTTYEQGHGTTTIPTGYSFNAGHNHSVHVTQVVTQHEASTAYTDDVITADYVYNEYRDKFDITPSNGNAKANIEEATKFYFKPNSITANTRTNQLCFHSQDLGCPQFDIMVEHIGLTEEGITPTRCELRNTALTLSYDASPIASNDTFAKATVSGEENIELWYIYDFGQGVTYESQVSLGDGDVRKAWSYQGTKVADDASINSTTGQITCSSNISDEQRVLYRNVTYILTITTTYLTSSITSNTVETVEQSNDLIELTITPEFYTFDHTGGTLIYQINSTRNGEPYPWSINLDDTKYVDWISFTPLTGEGASTVTVTCAANTDTTSESTRDTALRLHQQNRSTVVYASISQEPAPSYIYDIFVDNDTIVYDNGTSLTSPTTVNVTARRGIGTTYESVTTWEEQDWSVYQVNGTGNDQIQIEKNGNQLLITPLSLVEMDITIDLQVSGASTLAEGEEVEGKQGYCTISIMHQPSDIKLTLATRNRDQTNWPTNYGEFPLISIDSCTAKDAELHDITDEILYFEDDDFEHEKAWFTVVGPSDKFSSIYSGTTYSQRLARININMTPEDSFSEFKIKMEYIDKDGQTQTIIANYNNPTQDLLVNYHSQGFESSDEFIAYCAENPLAKARIYGRWFNIYATFVNDIEE